MKRWTCLILLVLGLTGCTVSAPAWETVEDPLGRQTAMVRDGAYTMAFDVPTGAAACVVGEGVQVYAQREGDYVITAQMLYASGVDSVIRRLTGLEPEQVQLLKTRRFGMEEYQFAWYAPGDEGGRLMQAAVLMDDLHGYALTFGVREGAGVSYADEVRQVFSSFNLYFDEGF